MIDGAVIAVVVPAFDEARWIEGVIRTMPSFVDWIIVVDDASNDDTAARATRASGSSRVTVLRHRTNRGVGAAIISGYARALALGADAIAVMAGDGEMDPADLRALLLPLLCDEADYVKGNRLRHADAWREMPLPRLIGTAVLGRLTGLATGLSVGDSQCGYTAAARRALERIDFDAIWPGYGYPNDLLGACARAGLRVREVPVRPVYQGAVSGLRSWHLGVIAFLLARAACRRLGAHRAPSSFGVRGGDEPSSRASVTSSS